MALRHVQANLLFLAGFAVMAAVVNVMLSKRLPWADASSAPVPAVSVNQMTPLDPPAWRLPLIPTAPGHLSAAAASALAGLPSKD